MVALTKLLKLLDKPALMFWANKIGLEGTSLNDFYKKSSKKGTNTHTDIQNYLLFKTPFPFQKQLDHCLEGFEIVSVEESFNNGFISCRADLLAKKDDKLTVIDFKSNKDIYLEQKLQLASYKEILKYDRIAIIDFHNWELKYIEIDTAKYFEIVLFLYEIHENLQIIGEKL